MGNLFSKEFSIVWRLVLGFGGALVFGRGTLYMKWGLILARHDRETRSSTGVERQRELVNHNLTFSIYP